MRRHLAAGVAVWLMAIGLPATAEVRQIEAEGAVLLTSRTGSSRPARDEAVRRALVEAVSRVAMDLLPDADETTAEFLPEVLGGEPLGYATRYRVIEDLGERPVIRSGAPQGAVEYVVLVEAHIDTERVRSRLASAGLLAQKRAKAAGNDVLVVVEALDGYAAYDALRRTLLDRVRVAGAVPVEMSQDRAVLRVSANRGPRQLLEALLQAAPPGLVVTPLGSDGGVLRLQIGLDATSLGAAGGGADGELPAAATGN